MTFGALRNREFLRLSTVLGLALLWLLPSGCGEDAPPAPEQAPEPVHAPALAPTPKAESLEALVAQPFAARHPKSGGKRFRSVPASESGLDFRHAWRPEQSYLGILGNAMAGGGVAVGELDGDGYPELVFTRPYGGTRLYRNESGNARDGAEPEAPFRFRDISEDAGILPDLWGGGAAFADLDNDGHQDLYVCGYDNPNRLYWNDGTLPLREGAEAAGLAFHGSSIMMAFADYDLDGDLDGYLLTNRVGTDSAPDFPPPDPSGRVSMPTELLEQWDVLYRPDGQVVFIPSGQYDHLYQNNGDGTFRDVSAEAGISGNHYGLSATWWDPDDDGWPDLYVANDFYGPDQLYHNGRDGRFTDIAQQSLPHTPWFSMGSDAGDIDGDLLQDFIASDMLGTTHERRHVTLTDLAEGRWFLEAAEPRQYMRNALYLNTGTPRFSEAAMTAGLARSDWTWSTVFGDLDLDGRLDLFISNGMSRDYFNFDMRKEAGLSGDIMGDYWLKQEPLMEANLAFRNAGDLDFQSVGPDWGLDHHSASFGAVLADLDRDGDLDAVMNDFEAPAALFENRTSEGHSVSVELRGLPGQSNRFGSGARVLLTSSGGGSSDGDGEQRTQVRHLSLSRGYMCGVEARLHFGLETHTKVERIEVRWPGGQLQLFEDLDVDSHYILRQESLAASAATPITSAMPPRSPPLFAAFDGPAHQESSFDDFEQQPLLPRRLSRGGPALACGDINGDGHDDLFRGGASGRAPQLLISTEQGLRPGALGALEFDDYYEDQGALFLDVDSDGDQDLYVVSGGVEGRVGSAVYRDRLYLNDGSGSFHRAPKTALPDLADAGSHLAAADVDGDGDLDLFVGGRSVPGAWPQAGSSRLLRNEGGVFRDASQELAPGLAEQGRVTAALFSDADQDGDPDLLVTHEWGPVRFWRNREGQFVDETQAAGLAALTGWWQGIACSDVDHDGDFDYVVGNLGLGSRTRASAEQPAVLFAGDLDGSGTNSLLETAWVEGVLRPLRTRGDVLSVMPILGEFFPTNDSWGRASIEEVFGGEALAAAIRLEATTCESGLLRNDGTGRFRFEALPRRAQISPVRSASFTEINGDGHPDLVLVQNDYSPQAEHGRLDGGMGLVLLGDGRGGWTPMRPDRSGFSVPGDGRSLSVFDLNRDAWADLVATVNDGPMRLFVRAPASAGAAGANTGANSAAGTGSPTSRSLAVRLEGPNGNLAAIGARVRFEQPEMPPQVAEVAGGSGLLGQAGGLLFFGVAWAPSNSTAAPLTLGSLHVTWPDGSTQEQAVSNRRFRFTLTYKGS